MAQLTFKQLAQKVLQEEQKPLSPDELWAVALKKDYAKDVSSRGKTPWRTIGAQLYVDVRDNPSSIFANTDTRPKRFYLRSILTPKQANALDDAKETEIAGLQKLEYLERQLHPFLVYFGFHYLKAYVKTIRHGLSSKKEFGEWVHPDVVGCYYPFSDWKGEVVELSGLMGNKALKFFSFEIKRELNLGNLRESFFQAVSNSSWANEGYLVAAEVSNGEDFRDELERLSSAFGIGVIRIDIQDPDSWEIIFPARPRELVDWETVNKLAFNPDFRDFLKRVKIDLTSREIRQELYDHVLNREELIKSITKSS